MHTRNSLVVAVAIFWLSGCAGSSYVKDAEIAEKAGRYDQAVALYSRALEEKPDERHIAQDLERAKLRASQAHALEGVRRMALGDLRGAEEELEIALTLNPTDRQLAAQLRELEDTITESGEEAERRSLAALKRQIRDAPFGSLDLASGAIAPASFVFRSASLRDVLLSLGTLAGVNVVFDSDFRDEDVFDRSRGCDLRGSLPLPLYDDTELLPRGERQSHHDHPGHPGEAAGI